MRFIHYFEAFNKGIIKSPSIKYLTKITLKGIPNVAGMFKTPGSTPFFEVFQIEGLKNNYIYDNRNQAITYNHSDGVVIYFSRPLGPKEKFVEFHPLKLWGNILI